MKLLPLEEYVARLNEKKIKAKLKKKESVRKKKIRIKKALRKRRKERAYQKELKRQREKSYKYYHDKKNALEKEKKAKGDRHNLFTIMVTKDGKRVEIKHRCAWFLDAYEEFERLYNDNNNNVIGEKIFVRKNGKNNEKRKLVRFGRHELLLLERTKPGEDNKTFLRSKETGKYEENVITDYKAYKIIDKRTWKIPEFFYVYGYNPVTDKKTGKWIVDNILLKNADKGVKRVFMLNNKIIVDDYNDFEFITFVNEDECKSVYREFYLLLNKDKRFLFTGKLPQNVNHLWYDKMMKKTGWNRNKCSSKSKF